MPEDGEIVDVLRYGKIKTMRFYKPYMAFNPYSSYARLGRIKFGRCIRGSYVQ